MDFACEDGVGEIGLEGGDMDHCVSLAPPR